MDAATARRMIERALPHLPVPTGATGQDLLERVQQEPVLRALVVRLANRIHGLEGEDRLDPRAATMRLEDDQEGLEVIPTRQSWKAWYLDVSDLAGAVGMSVDQLFSSGGLDLLASRAQEQMVYGLSDLLAERGW